MISEPEPESSDDDESEGEQARLTRYMFSSVSEVSDPEEWQNMHHRNLDTDDSSVEQDDQVPVVHDSHDSQSSGFGYTYSFASEYFEVLHRVVCMLYKIETTYDRGVAPAWPLFCSFVSTTTGVCVL